MAPHNYHFEVKMTCGGCSGAIERVLNKTEGIESKNVSLENQTVDITTKDDSDLSYDTLLEKIKKTGKQVLSGSEDGVTKAI